MARSVSVYVAVSIALAGLTARAAHADTGMLPNGATIVWDKAYITEKGNVQVPSTPDVLRQYLNLAHCVCSKAGAGTETTIQYDVRLTADTNTSRPGEVWVGTQCDDDQQRPMSCRAVDTIPDIDLLVTRPERIELSLFDVINGADNTGPCREDEGDAFAWVLVDSDGDATFDYFSNISIGNTTNTPTDQRVKFDTKPPPVPTEFEGSSAEGSIVLSWTPPESNATDVLYYQALCAKSDGTPAVTDPPSPRFQTVRDVCGLDSTITLQDVTLAGSDDALATIPDAMRQLDPTYLCGESTDPTATGLTIRGLENGVSYSIALLSIDLAGNVSGVAFTTTVTPQPATDFWEDLHDRGSNVEGGFCLASIPGGGDSGPWSAGVVVLAVLIALSRPRLRRRGGRARLVAVALVLAPVVASAQSPYWEDESAGFASEDEVNWHAGIRVGPYMPEIDEQFGEQPGPYEEMFGDEQIMPVLDVDRILWRGFGQLGVGGSIGYMQKTAKAWADGSSPNDPMRERSEGDENTFRLLPLALTAVYRFTWLDDNYGIPLVPYVRGGISYYLWWIRTNGETSTACWDGTHDPTCDSDSAIGASFGLQGSIGLAIRAERLDADTATSMRTSGILHAGFYVELQAAKVNGFGRDEKLSVGDTTYFGGVNFEF